MHQKHVPLGWLLIDKPQGITSAQATTRIKGAFGMKKGVGHSGTLDPLASGLLLIGVGKATRLFPYIQNEPKVYDVTVTWGNRTTTDDAWGESLDVTGRYPTKEEIEKTLPQFTGKISQTPPQFSACKVAGKRGYALARQGLHVPLSPKDVTIFFLELVAHRGKSSDFRVTCGSGTYMRSLARDMGEVMTCQGYVQKLRRLSIGRFHVHNALRLDSFEKMRHDDPEFWSVLGPCDQMLDDIPALHLKAADAQKICQGQRVPVDAQSGLLRLFHRDFFLGLGCAEGGFLKPKTMVTTHVRDEGELKNDVDDKRA
jgi:tRNA pseudouridine55 synthase